MATPSDAGDYVTLSDVTLWMAPDAPNEIHMTSNDSDLKHPKTGPGMRVVFSANPKSANYHPANYNRAAAVLRKYGKSAPAEDTPEGPRRLDKRPGIGRSPKGYQTTGDESDGPYDVQVYRPEVDADDPLGHVGSVIDMMGWLNMHGHMRVEALTAIPQDDGGPPVYMVLWRKP